MIAFALSALVFWIIISAVQSRRWWDERNRQADLEADEAIAAWHDETRNS